MAGNPAPDSRTLDGRNILPVLTGALNESPTRYSTSSITTASLACATQDWKIPGAGGLPQHRALAAGRDLRLLFDMRTDPTERYSLAAHHPDKWRELERHLVRAQQEFAAIGEDSPQ